MLFVGWLDGVPVGLAVVAAVGHCFELRLTHFWVMGEFHPVLNLGLFDRILVAVLNRILNEGSANDAAFQHWRLLVVLLSDFEPWVWAYIHS